MSAAVLCSFATQAAADAPCVNGLPHDRTKANGHWYTGGAQNIQAVFDGVRANIRTYNGYTAAEPIPYSGGSSAWVALVGGANGGAQVGWAKAWNVNSPAPLDAVEFFQWFLADGTKSDPQWFSRIYPPGVQTYEVRRIPSNPGTNNYEFKANNRTLGFTPFALDWSSTAHEAFTEVWNLTGDQLPGDLTAHTTFRSWQWSPDGIFWNGTSPFFYKGEPLVNPGYPKRNQDPYNFDELSWPDGSNFDTWDKRCP